MSEEKQNIEHHEAGNDGEKKKLSPKEIHANSLRNARSIISSLKPDEIKDDNAFSTAQAFEKMARVDAKAGSALAIHVWSKRLEALGNSGKNELAQVYFLGTTLGDADALDKLKGILQEEQTEKRVTLQEARESGRVYSYSTSKILRNIVETCADKRIPADTWIREFALDENHRDLLKLDYYRKTKKEDSEVKTLGLQYREEATEHFLSGEDLGDDFVIANARSLWHTNDDPEIKKRILQKVQEVVNDDSPITFDSYTSFLSFANTALDEGQIIGQEGAQWFEQTAERMQQAFLEAGADPYEVNRRYGTFQISLAQYYGATPNELVEKIDTIISEQLSMEIFESHVEGDDPIRNREHIELLRDSYIEAFAVEYAKKGDFEAANTFLAAIGNDASKRQAIRESLEMAKTSEQVAMIKPDEMTMMFDEKMGEVFRLKEAILSRDIEEVGRLAKEYVVNPEYNKYTISRQLIADCIRATYENDSAKGTKLVDELKTIYKDRGANDSLVQGLASLQLELKDPSGLQVFYEEAQKADKPIERFRKFVNVASQAEFFLAA